ncbi:hypothetical protein [Spongiibacter marinus]|uniref:hypothetical protein n=1 Tax=Spongiibacter marinus TaxID=354246 RepID=UPI00048395D8|nr:hypothetical protein [Spongiibacter marinus]
MKKANEPDSQIQIMRLGELRMLGIEPPDALRDGPDEDMLTMPRHAGQKWASQILRQWNVPSIEAAAFINAISSDDLSNIIVIHQFVRVLFPNLPPADYIHVEIRAFEERSPWQLVQCGESSQVRKYLAYHVFGGGW